MTGFIDTLSESFKQTLNWSMWLYFLLVFLIEGIILGIIALIFVFIGFFAFLGPITAVGGIENVGMLFSNPSFIANSIGTIWILFTVFIIIATFVEAIFIGMKYHLFNDFLKTGKFNLGKAFQKAKPRILTFFIISLILGLIILAVLALAFAPILFMLPGLISGTVASSNAALIIAPLLFSVLLVFLVGLVLLLISPMLNLLAPTAFFEEKGAIGTIKKSFELMKANYFGNLAYLILFFLIIFAIRMFLQVLFLPLTILIGVIEAGGTQLIGLVILLGLISFIIMFIYTVWMSVFDTVAFRNLYFFDKSLLAKHTTRSHTKPKHKAKPKRKTKSKRKKKK